MQRLVLFVLFMASLRVAAQNLQPTADHALLKVLIVDNKKKPQDAQTVTFTSLKDHKVFSGTTGANGRFSMLIPPGQKYKVSYNVFNMHQDDQVLDLPASATPYTFEYTITITPPRTFTLNNVFFDSGKSSLRPESDKELNQLAEYMNLKKSLIIEIAGHTDNVGSADANQKLSEDRANAVKQYLVKKGIADNRVQAKGYGDTQPVADNDTPQGRQQNRRTEVRIISE
ncbi:MAG TPA: OmpA family protein [Chitinophagales bacterium]|nr:OmpA family protein [Chitinophagales bacterium]